MSTENNSQKKDLILEALNQGKKFLTIIGVGEWEVGQQLSTDKYMVEVTTVENEKVTLKLTDFRIN